MQPIPAGAAASLTAAQASMDDMVDLETMHGEPVMPFDGPEIDDPNDQISEFSEEESATEDPEAGKAERKEAEEPISVATGQERIQALMHEMAAGFSEKEVLSSTRGRTEEGNEVCSMEQTGNAAKKTKHAHQADEDLHMGSTTDASSSSPAPGSSG